MTRKVDLHSMCIHKPMCARKHAIFLHMNLSTHTQSTYSSGTKDGNGIGSQGPWEEDLWWQSWSQESPVSLRRSRRLCVSLDESFLKGLHVMLTTAWLVPGKAP